MLRVKEAANLRAAEKETSRLRLGLAALCEYVRAQRSGAYRWRLADAQRSRKAREGMGVAWDAWLALLHGGTVLGLGDVRSAVSVSNTPPPLVPSRPGSVWAMRYSSFTRNVSSPWGLHIRFPEAWPRPAGVAPV